MYKHIRANIRRTILLVVVFAAVIIALGWLIGWQTGDPSTWIILASMLSTGMALFGYFAGDKVALTSSGAKQIQKEDAPELWRLVENLCITGGIPMPKVYIIQDASPNAFATGRNPKHASIAFTTGLLETLDRSELEGVVAHELSHVKNYDILVMTIVIVLVGIIMLLADWVLRMTFFGRSNGDNRNGGSQLTLILVVVGLALSILSPLFAELIKLAISRSREYLADASGALLTRHPEGLAKALEKISRNAKPMQRANKATAHLFISSPFGAKKARSLFSTHPPAEERIRRLYAMIDNR